MLKDFKVRCNFEHRTSVELRRLHGLVKHIILDESGVRVRKDLETVYDYNYNRLLDCSVTAACETFAQYGRYVGITKEAQRYLSQIINRTINEEELDNMELKKKKLTKTGNAKKTGDAKKTGAKRGSVAQMFQTLIMEGKLNDDQIFEKVKAAFGLDDKKRGYVSWYRCYLKRKGEKVPARVEKKAKK